jgi:hypothetical protein
LIKYTDNKPESYCSSEPFSIIVVLLPSFHSQKQLSNRLNIGFSTEKDILEYCDQLLNRDHKNSEDAKQKASVSGETRRTYLHHILLRLMGDQLPGKDHRYDKDASISWERKGMPGD